MNICYFSINRTRAAPPTNLLDETVTNDAPVLNMRAAQGRRGGGHDSTVVEMKSNTSSGSSSTRRHTMVPPRSNISGGRGSVSNTSGGRLGGPRAATKVKQPLLPAKIPQSAVKTSEAAEDTDEEEVTDEMMNVAYTRSEFQ